MNLKRLWILDHVTRTCCMGPTFFVHEREGEGEVLVLWELNVPVIDLCLFQVNLAEALLNFGICVEGGGGRSWRCSQAPGSWVLSRP